MIQNRYCKDLLREVLILKFHLRLHGPRLNLIMPFQALAKRDNFKAICEVW